MTIYKYNNLLYHAECLSSEEIEESTVVRDSRGRQCAECGEYLDELDDYGHDDDDDEDD